MSTESGPTAPIDLERPWRRSTSVGLRPEPFGALAYHFDTRRLVFLKSPALVELVETLGSYPSARAAVAAAERSSHTGRRAFEQALAHLADAGVIVPAMPTEAAPVEVGG